MQLSVFQQSIFEKYPKYRLVHIYNKLSQDFKNISRLSFFRKALVNFLLNLNLYSVNNYYELVETIVA
jgi:hypothetical protein